MKAGVIANGRHEWGLGYWESEMEGGNGGGSERGGKSEWMAGTSEKLKPYLFFLRGFG